MSNLIPSSLAYRFSFSDGRLALNELDGETEDMQDDTGLQGSSPQDGNVGSSSRGVAAATNLRVKGQKETVAWVRRQRAALTKAKQMERVRETGTEIICPEVG